ncbi:hypothetical protein ACOMHN_041577 [Nucella lapillus]
MMMMFQMKGEVKDMMRDAVKNYYKRETSRKFMDTVQGTFHCCGADKAAMDYLEQQQVPDSCQAEYRDKQQQVPDSCQAEYRDKPCDKEFFDWMAEHLIIVAGVAIAIAIVLILGMIFSMALCCALRDTV